ncbi:MAG: beta-phosphoglucomutase [Corynebacterium sp.]|nr:beta-phosphoglucomutase [Corynebacterium sp.]
MKRTFEVSPWNIRTSEWAPEDKLLQESMTSLANENLGMRGFFEEGYSGETLQGVYIGGVWLPDKTRVGWWKNGYPEYFGKMINSVNYLALPIKVNGEQLDLAVQTPENFLLDLDMKTGFYVRSFEVTIGGARVAFTFERFVDAVVKERVMQRVNIHNLTDSEITVTVESTIDGDVYNKDSNYGEQFWNVLDKNAKENFQWLTSRTIPNPFGVPQFTVTAATITKTELPQVDSELQDKAVVTRYEGTVSAGETAVVEKRSFVATSRDHAEDALVGVVEKLAQEAEHLSFKDIREASNAEWAHRWESADIEIGGDDAAQQGIRFNLFQLFSTYYGRDPRLNIGPKGFTGEKYGGATYWDTEAFCLPVYLGIADPKVSRSLLEYRYLQLDGARHNARQQGLAGALYPMVTFNGIECHNEWEITFEEIHRNGDIAFAIYNYTNYTGDKSFVLNEGAEILVEMARFWADRVHYSARKGVYMIHGVTGPDEYQNNVNNNWNTNILAKWSLEYTLEILAEVTAEVAARLNVSEDEKRLWKGIAENMYLPYDEELGIIVQDDSFLDKELKPVSEIPSDQLPLNQNWSWDKILRSPYIKQGDVIQALWYFIDDYTKAEKKRNFDFYEQFTVHESSLSASIYAILAADIGYEAKAVEMYERSARLDLDNYNNDTDDGLHITSMTGSWLDIVHGFAGMRVRDGELHYDPFLPAKWTSYTFRQNFRGRVIEVKVTREGATYTLVSGEPLIIDVAGQKRYLGPVSFEDVKGFAFDLDGVIADTARFHHDAWKAIAEELGITWNPALSEGLKGLSREDSLDLILKDGGVLDKFTAEQKAELATRKNDHYLELLNTVSAADVLPGTMEFIKDLKDAGYKLALASASRNAPIVLEKLGLGELFDAIVDPASLSAGKPDPAIYIEAAKAIGLEPHEVVGVEDAQSGVDAILAAGEFAIGIGEDLTGSHQHLASTRQLSLDGLRRYMGA